MADLAGAPALTAAEKSKGVMTVAGRSNPKDDCPCNQDIQTDRECSPEGNEDVSGASEA